VQNGQNLAPPHLKIKMACIYINMSVLWTFIRSYVPIHRIEKKAVEGQRKLHDEEFHSLRSSHRVRKLQSARGNVNRTLKDGRKRDPELTFYKITATALLYGHEQDAGCSDEICEYRGGLYTVRYEEARNEPCDSLNDFRYTVAEHGQRVVS